MGGNAIFVDQTNSPLESASSNADVASATSSAVD